MRHITPPHQLIMPGLPADTISSVSMNPWIRRPRETHFPQPTANEMTDNDGDKAEPHVPNGPVHPREG